jgi:hypothetical protein
VSTEFWLGLGLSIPVGIGVNLLTPKFSGWLSASSGRFAAVSRKRQLAREKLGRDLRDNPFAYSAFLQRVNSRLSTYLVLIVIAINVPFYLNQILRNFSSNLFVPYQTLYLLTILILTFLAVGFLNTRRRGNDTSALIARLGSNGDETPSE